MITQFPWGELDPRHESLHKHHAAAARDMNALAIGGIGQICRIESAAFVRDLDSYPFPPNRQTTWMFFRHRGIAVMDGVTALLPSPDARRRSAAAMLGLKLGEHFIENLPRDPGVRWQSGDRAPQPRVGHGRFPNQCV